MLHDHIRTILSANEKKKCLNILVIGATHERYEQQLCLTGHNFYSYKDGGKEWNIQYGDIPSNYHQIDVIPSYIRPDLVLTHVSGNRLSIANELADHYGLNVIRHTHTLPQSKEELVAFHGQSASLDTFISDYSRKAWESKDGLVINHGLDTDFWCESLDLKRSDDIFSVVNFFADRNWACGFDLYNEIKNKYSGRYTLSGNNSGLSVPAVSLAQLRLQYNSCGIFLNTSQFSPIPMSLLEAMACGSPCVSSNTCMIPEIIKHGYNGLLASTPEGFAECINILQKDELFARELGKNAKKTILKLFNIENFINNWNNTFKRVLIK